METSPLIKTQITWVSYFLSLSIVLIGCGSYGDSKEKPTAVVTSDKTSIFIGESIVFDASTSTFDSLQWFLNGSAQTECTDQSTCIITPTQQGSYEVAIQSKVKENSKAADASLIVQVETSAVSSSAVRTTTTSVTNTPAVPAGPFDQDGTLQITTGSVALTNLSVSTVTMTWHKAADTVAAEAKPILI